MAKHAYTSEDVTLMDDTRVTLRPLVIAKLKKFMAAWEKMGALVEKIQAIREVRAKEDAQDENAPDHTQEDRQIREEELNILIECAGWGLESELLRLRKVTETFDEDDEMTNEYREYLESTLDMDTIYRVLDVASKIKLDDPKLLAAAEQAAMAAME